MYEVIYGSTWGVWVVVCTGYTPDYSQIFLIAVASHRNLRSEFSYIEKKNDGRARQWSYNTGICVAEVVATSGLTVFNSIQSTYWRLFFLRKFSNFIKSSLGRLPIKQLNFFLLPFSVIQLYCFSGSRGLTVYNCCLANLSSTFR